MGFRFRRPRLTPTALEMRLVANPDMFSGDGAVEWPLWQDDVKLRWLFFQDRLTVGRSPDCALVLEDCTADVAAEIYFADGYWIAPSSGAEISISAIPVRHAIPVPTGHSVSIAGSTVSVHLITDASETAKSSPASRAAAG